MQACKLTLLCKHCKTTWLCTRCHANPKRPAPQSLTRRRVRELACGAPALLPLCCWFHGHRGHFCPLQTTQKQLPEHVLNYSWALTCSSCIYMACFRSRRGSAVNMKAVLRQILTAFEVFFPASMTNLTASVFLLNMSSS